MKEAEWGGMVDRIDKEVREMRLKSNGYAVGDWFRHRMACENNIDARKYLYSCWFSNEIASGDDASAMGVAMMRFEEFPDANSMIWVSKLGNRLNKNEEALHYALMAKESAYGSEGLRIAVLNSIANALVAIGDVESLNIEIDEFLDAINSGGIEIERIDLKWMERALSLGARSDLIEELKGI